MRPSIAYSAVFPVDQTTESTCRSTEKLSRRGWPRLVSNLITVSVNMSIIILPLSQEFNWNSATVGLIHSSFFWGYLLTQILGGIWADKISGKLVLGFGVIWWSATTVLTPIAARAGLPFLLVMRAFMGIGEESEEEVTDTEQDENWFSLTYAQRICALLDRGWRRSGCFLYKPEMESICCPSYTICLKASDFVTSKEQLRVSKRMQRLYQKKTRNSLVFLISFTRMLIILGGECIIVPVAAYSF